MVGRFRLSEFHIMLFDFDFQNLTRVVYLVVIFGAISGRPSETNVGEGDGGNF